MPTQWSTEYRGRTATNWDLESNAIAGRLVELQQGDMTADGYAQLQQLAQQNGIRHMPKIYLDWNDDHTQPATDLLVTRQGQPYIMLNYNAMQVTPDFVRDHQLKSNSEIDGRIHSGELTEINRDYFKSDNVRIFDRYTEMARELGISSTPNLYLDMNDGSMAPTAEARVTREGRNYITINQAALREWTPDQLIAVLGHELDHVARGDVQPAALAATHNSQSAAVEAERRADIEGSAIKSSTGPEALREALKIGEQLGQQQYINTHPGATAQDFDAMVERTHPSASARDTYLRQQPQRNR